MARGKGERRCRTSNFKWKLQFSLGIPRLQSPPFCLQASLPRPPSIPFAGDFRQSGSLLWRPASWSHPPRRDTGQRDSDSRLQLRTNERSGSPRLPLLLSLRALALLNQPLSLSLGPFSDCPPPLEPRTEAPVPARSAQRKERGCQLGHSHVRGPVPAHWAPSRTLTTTQPPPNLVTPTPSP